jgi:hypothetical protein
MNVLVVLPTELLENGNLHRDEDLALEVLNLIAKRKEQPDFVLDKSICIKGQVRADREQPDITVCPGDKTGLPLPTIRAS